MTAYEYAAFNEAEGMVGLGPTELSPDSGWNRNGIPDGIRSDVLDWRRDGYPDTHVRRRPIGEWERFDNDLDPVEIPVYDSARRQIGTAVIDGMRIDAVITDGAAREAMAFGTSSILIGSGSLSATIVDDWLNSRG